QDLNGDGYSDWIGREGAIRILYGAPSWASPAANAITILDTVATVAVGDLNGDGFGDLVASWHHPTRPEVHVYVFPRTSTGPSFSTAFYVLYPGAFAPQLQAGTDLNGDGYDDLVIQGVDNDSAPVAVVHPGSTTWPTAAPTYKLASPLGPGLLFSANRIRSGDV